MRRRPSISAERVPGRSETVLASRTRPGPGRASGSRCGSPAGAAGAGRGRGGRRRARRGPTARRRSRRSRGRRAARSARAGLAGRGGQRRTGEDRGHAEGERGRIELGEDEPEAAEHRPGEDRRAQPGRPSCGGSPSRTAGDRLRCCGLRRAAPARACRTWRRLRRGPPEAAAERGWSDGSRRARRQGFGRAARTRPSSSGAAGLLSAALGRKDARARDFIP
jgi:hypothetical protein